LSNPVNVKKFFEELSSILTKYNLIDRPERIFNVDEKGITLNHMPPHVVSGTGVTPQVVTTGKSSTITILGCGSASGIAIPLLYFSRNADEGRIDGRSNSRS
jgi:hypothetical protein